MEHTTEVYYISIDDKPKRGRGIPNTCKLSYEDTRQRTIETAKTYYNDNFEYARLQKGLWLGNAYNQRQDTI